MRTVLLASIIAAIGGASSWAAPATAEMNFLGSTTNGSSLAVVVGDSPLVHTAQIWPEAKNADVSRQTEEVLAKLEQVLESANASKASVAKLNVYLAHDEAAPKVKAVLAKTFSGRQKPAVTFAVGELAEPKALVAIDAVAVASASTKEVKLLSAANGINSAAILPPGPKLYVSGMADTNSLLPATRKTLEKLVATIGHLGSKRADIVQLKVFLQPMSEIADVRKEVVDFFGGNAPPTVFVDWISANPVVEIELIALAHGDTNRETETVGFFTPPGTTDSKIFRRVARVNHGKLVYVSGLLGDTSSGTNQVREIFATLKGVTHDASSDFEHLVKATYYVTDNEASNALNDIRPEFYNPKRAPAASKAKIKGVGDSGKTVSLDMIAVTR